MMADRSDIKDADEEEMEKMPSVSERIKKMETKKIRFAVLREKAAQRRYVNRREVSLLAALVAHHCSIYIAYNITSI